MEDGFCDDPNTDSHGRAIVAFVLDCILGVDRTYFSRVEILLSLDSDHSQGSALVPPNGDKGNQGT